MGKLEKNDLKYTIDLFVVYRGLTVLIRNLSVKHWMIPLITG